jgi:hypothetical protein
MAKKTKDRFISSTFNVLILAMLILIYGCQEGESILLFSLCLS